MTANPTPLFAEGSGAVPGSETGMATCAENAQVQPAPAAMPSEEDGARTIYESNPRNKRWDLLADKVKDRYREQARAVLALFAPMAEKERVERAPYSIGEPEGGWRNHGSFSREEKAKLRPVAETLAMLDGNAFFGNEVSAGAEWYEQYLPEAHALYEGNGGDSGWAGEASFAKPDARALAAEAALRSLRQAILDADIICDDDEKAGDRLSRLAAAIRAQGE